MALVIEQKSKFTPIPEGTVSATISAVVDKGMQPIAPQYVEANKAQAAKEGRDPATVATSVRKLVIEYKDAEGNQASEWFTASLGAKSKLAARVKGLLGAPPTGAFDVETLVGTPVTLMVEAGVNTKGYTTAKVIAVTKRKASKKASAPANDHGVEIADDELGI